MCSMCYCVSNTIFMGKTFFQTISYKVLDRRLIVLHDCNLVCVIWRLHIWMDMQATCSMHCCMLYNNGYEFTSLFERYYFYFIEFHVGFLYAQTAKRVSELHTKLPLHVNLISCRISRGYLLDYTVQWLSWPKAVCVYVYFIHVMHTPQAK